MKHNSNDPQPNTSSLALTRFKVINALEDCLRAGLPLAEALRQASSRPWPDENGDHYAVRTLEDWWYAYQHGGFDALAPSPRSDRGKTRVLDDATIAWLIEQVSQHPQVHLKVLVTHARQSGRVLPSISVLYRTLRRHGYDRARLRAGRLATGPTKAFEAPAVNDLWMVDFSPGPTLCVDSKTVTTQLCVIIDDHSRLIPFAAYYLHANTEAFHHCLKEALLRRGLPRKLYTDQGKPFVNAHTRLVCAQVGIRLLHCKPYHAWSKGKCERVIQTLQQGFESTLGLEGNRATSLEMLNLKLSLWIQSVYHQRVHSSTDQSPELRYQQAASTLRHLAPGLEHGFLFLGHNTRCLSQERPRFKS